ncbi:NAD-dependent epimerase/dehydratase family protein [Chitinophaga lutea]
MTTLITGYSGFLGNTLTATFRAYGNPVATLGRAAGADVKCDLSDCIPVLPEDITQVVHAAGLAHVSGKENARHHLVNFEGTVHLLTALERASALSCFIFISTVAVYGASHGEEIDEDHPLNANTPYGISKIRAEEAIRQWCEERNIRYYILRLPLIVGQHPPGNLGKMIAAFRKGRYISIGGNKARKSMVLASDVASLCRTIQGPSGTYNLTDGIHPPFREIENALANALGTKNKFEIPLTLLRFGAKAGNLLSKCGVRFPLNDALLEKLTSNLTFSDAKARKLLGWAPSPCIPFIEHYIR